MQQVVNLTSNDLKNGMGIEIDNVPYRVVGAQPANLGPQKLLGTALVHRYS